MQILISSVTELYNWDMSLLNSNINEKVEIFNSIFFFNRLSDVWPREAAVWQRSTLLQRKDQKKIFSPGNIEDLNCILLNYWLLCSLLGTIKKHLRKTTCFIWGEIIILESQRDRMLLANALSKKTILNKRIALTTPVFDEIEFVKGFKEKLYIFDSFFAK